MKPHQEPEPEGWPPDAIRDRLIGDWHIYQRQGGHKTSTDDLVTAWYACHRNPGPIGDYLDLGCGIGSVFFMVCHKVRPVRAMGVEGQPQSALMATRALREVPDIPAKYAIHQGDFRQHDFAGQTFDLITGSPPYFPLGTGVAPADAQRRACRFEVRGGVEGYMHTAASVLSAAGRFYLVFQTVGRKRVVDAATAAGLFVTGQADFLMRRDREQPFLSVFECAGTPSADIHRFTCPVRDSDGEVSGAYNQIRRALGVAS